MIKRIKVLLVLVLSFSTILAVALPAAYMDDVHYKINTQRLAVSNNKSIEVLELFMYTCPHCYHLEPEVDDWKSSMDDNVSFAQVPAVFSLRQVPFARAFYAAESLGYKEKLHPLFFEAIHEDGLQLSTEKQILDYVASQGIERQTFEKMMKSFAVKTKVKKATAVTKKSGITGVPAFVINGQYHTSVPMAGGVEQLFSVVDFLIGHSSD